MKNSLIHKKAPQIIGFLLIVVIILSVLLATYVFQGQNIGSTNQLSKVIATAIKQSKEVKMDRIYSSDSYGYQLVFDPQIWRESGSTHLDEDKNLLDVTLSLRESADYSYTTFRVDTIGTELEEIITEERKKDPTGSDLDLYVARKARLINAAYAKDPLYNPSLEKKEKIHLGTRDYYKFTYKEKTSSKLAKDNTSLYYEYITLGDPVKVSGSKVKGKLNGTKVEKVTDGKDFTVQYAYSILTRFPHITQAQAQNEKFISSIRFFPPKTQESYFLIETDDSVKGASTQPDQINTFDEVQLVELTKPSVVNILTSTCAKVVINKSEETIYLKPSYTFCNAFMGSGFIVNKDGYVATNGHVVRAYPEETFIQTLTDPQLSDFLKDLVKAMLYLHGQEIPDDATVNAAILELQNKPNTLDLILTELYSYMDQGLVELQPVSTNYYVKLGNKPFDFDIPAIQRNDWSKIVSTSNSILEAKLVDSDYPNYYSVETLLHKTPTKGSDVAVLKLNNPEKLSFPSLSIASSTSLKEGMSILVLGYPGLVSGQGDELISKSSSSQPTITRGIISALKKDVNGYSLIQTDASIDHGNSGGPAFNSKGEVIGIATYGIQSQSGNFNLLRATEDLKPIFEKHSIALADETEGEWKQGLEKFWGQHYQQSITSFNKVKTSYWIHPLADDYISDAQIAIQNGEDIDMIQRQKFIKTLSITAGVIILILLAVVIVIILKRKKKIQPQSSQPNPVVNPTPQVAPPVVQTQQPPQTTNTL